MDKTLLEPREMVRPKEVCFSESSLRTGDRTRSSYYLNVGGAEKGASTPQFSPGSQGPRGFTPTPQWSRSEIQSFTSAEKDGLRWGDRLPAGLAHPGLRLPGG